MSTNKEVQQWLHNLNETINTEEEYLKKVYPQRKAPASESIRETYANLCVGGPGDGLHFIDGATCSHLVYYAIRSESDSIEEIVYRRYTTVYQGETINFWVHSSIYERGDESVTDAIVRKIEHG